MHISQLIAKKWLKKNNDKYKILNVDDVIELAILGYQTQNHYERKQSYLK